MSRYLGSTTTTEQQRFTTPVEGGVVESTDEGDAELSEEEAAYEAGSDRYTRQGSPPEVLGAFAARRRGRPRTGARVTPDTCEAVRRAALEEGLSEAGWPAPTDTGRALTPAAP